MTTSTHLIHSRRFLPLFVTQLLGAFNDNLFKNAMVLYVVYSIYNSEEAEAQFSAIASAVFIIPFFALSGLSGQLADMRDKARIIRVIKFCEILIMLVGGAGLVMAWKDIAVTAVAIPLIAAAMRAIDPDGEWYSLGQIGQFITQANPDFDTRTYGSAKLSDLIRKLPRFEVKQDGSLLKVRDKA